MKNGHLVKPVVEYIEKKYVDSIRTIYQNTVKELQEEIIGLNDHINKISYYVWNKEDYKIFTLDENLGSKKLSIILLKMGDIIAQYIDQEDQYRENIQYNSIQVKKNILDEITKKYDLIDEEKKLLFDFITELLDLTPYGPFNQTTGIHVSKEDKNLFNQEDYMIKNLTKYKNYGVFSPYLVKMKSYHNKNNFFHKLREAYIIEKEIASHAQHTIAIDDITYIIKKHIENLIEKVSKEHHHIQETRESFINNMYAIENKIITSKQELLKTLFQYNLICKQEPISLN